MKNTVFFWRNNILRLWLGIFAVAACFVLCGCEFDQPVSSVPNARIDENLIGEWKSPNYKVVKISKIDAEHYQILYDGAPFLNAYHTDFGERRFISGKVIDKARYMIFSYTLENNNRKLRLKTVGYDMIRSDKTQSSEIKKIIGDNLQNPKLFMDEEVFERISPPITSSASANKIVTNKQTPTIKSGRFNSKDAVIYYEIYGAEKSGTPLFVLHGGPGFDHLYFLSNSAFTDLAKNRPVVFYDQRGTGKSAKLTEENAATVKNNVEDLENLRSYLGYNKIDVAGHSWGGFLAMAYAVFFQENVSHLIIIDSMPSNYNDDFSTFEKDYPNENAEMDRKKAESIANNLDPVAMRASTVAYMKMLFYSTQNRDRFIAGSNNYTFAPMVFGTISYSAQGLDITPGLAKLTIPALIIHGRHDSNISVVSAEKIHNAIPKSKLVIFEQSGHMPFYEEKETFDAWMESFLSK